MKKNIPRNINTMSFNRDIKFGELGEDNVLSIIENHTGAVFKPDKYSPYDFYNDEYIVEVKTRRNTYNKYPTTFLTQHKFDTLMKDKRRKLFVFSFTDGVYFVEIDKNNIDKLKQNDYGGRNDRGKDEYRTNGYCHFPIEMLTSHLA